VKLAIFAFHIELIGGKVGNKEERAKFCTKTLVLISYPI